MENITNTIKTSQRYTAALIDMKSKLEAGERINITSFTKEHHISNQFTTAIVEGRFAFRKWNGRRYIYEWNPDHQQIDQEHGEWIRQFIYMNTNGGKAAKREYSQPVDGRRTGTKQARKSAKNGQIGPLVATNIPYREPLPPPQPKKVVSREKIVEQIRGSLFNSLCPQCAETMHQIIDLLTLKNES